MKPTKAKRLPSHPLDFIRTEVSIPFFGLEHRCHLCQLYWKSPDIYLEMSQRLLLAQDRQEIFAWLKSKKVATSIGALHRHYKKHIEPHVREMLEFERRLRMEVHVLEEADGINIAAAFSRKLAADGLSALHNLNLASQLANIRKPELVVAVLREFGRLCKALADIDRATAEVALKEELVKLRRMEVENKAGILNERSMRQVEAALRDHPDLARQVRNALASSRAKPLAALPGNAETNSRPQPSRGRRPRAGRQR